MNKAIFVFILLISFKESAAQTIVPVGKIVTDTIRLKGINAGKVVAYKFRSVTFFIDYKKFKEAYLQRVKLWRHHDDGEDTLNTKNSWEKEMFRCNQKLKKLSDSTAQLLNKEEGKLDTIYLSQDPYDNYCTEPREPLQDFLPAQLELWQCAIKDGKNVLQPIIIRQKGEWSFKGTNSSYEGTRYFIPGEKVFFLEGVDIIKN